jgi:hypothetical protein
MDAAGGFFVKNPPATPLKLLKSLCIAIKISLLWADFLFCLGRNWNPKPNQKSKTCVHKAFKKPRGFLNVATCGFTRETGSKPSANYRDQPSANPIRRSRPLPPAGIMRQTFSFLLQ